MTSLTIDERINDLIREHNKYRVPGAPYCHYIEQWTWHGKPSPYIHYSTPSSKRHKTFGWMVYAEICKATVEECLYSKSEYVRNVKQWSLGNFGLPEGYDLLSAVQSISPKTTAED